MRRASAFATIFVLMMAFMAMAAFGQQPPGADYRGIVENASSIIITWDNQTRLTYINPFGLQYFGFTRDELIGKSIVGTFVPATSTSGQDLAGMIRDIAVHPQRYASNQNENVKKDGERVQVLWSNKAIRDEKGNVVGIISIGNIVK